VAQSCIVGEGESPGTCAVCMVEISLSHSLEAYCELQRLRHLQFWC
jgi:hypothetical protein